MDGPQQDTPTDTSPASAPPHRPVTGAATAATVLILLELVREVLVSVGNWRDYFVVHAYLAGTATDADLDAADSDVLTAVGSLPTLLVWIGGGVAFLVWLWRARINAELMGGAAAHRRSRGWVVGAWIMPVANLWYPYQVVSDIWQASAPQRPAPVTLVNAWWALFVAGMLVKPIQWRMAMQEATEQDVLANANMSTVLTVLYLVAGALIILIMRRITTWQTHGSVQNAV
ncbi:hypothetical protein GCM10010174_02430 [Kutzneria viridogrisea]|uniref:DUF4328 domain-containing protein n=2 Tax=Kutzneria TaxID=43356 RepID=W5W9R7_9PSEU|nr:DUF4328 domain-containing protein [Kutzneria albida]AHH97652.1 hypothetical protein KALB_4290 [Kutzneria albida DSM 43870]MBA8924761.1 hypothetical protein [Kutzneria viridogrisea]